MHKDSTSLAPEDMAPTDALTKALYSIDATVDDLNVIAKHVNQLIAELKQERQEIAEAATKQNDPDKVVSLNHGKETQASGG